MKDMITIIVAIAENGAIGSGNSLLWNIPEDLKRFRRITMGHNLIMGKNTWYSLPRRPLPGRLNVVMTDNPCECIDDCVCAYSADDALSKCNQEKEVFIIGGGMVYREFLERAHRLMVTHVHKEYTADTFFPDIDPEIWEETEREDREFDPECGFSYSYITYYRR